jgi:hypothetical protein
MPRRVEAIHAGLDKKVGVGKPTRRDSSKELAHASRRAGDSVR